jgi:hypothetical protein
MFSFVTGFTILGGSTTLLMKLISRTVGDSVVLDFGCSELPPFSW